MGFGSFGGGGGLSPQDRTDFEHMKGTITTVSGDEVTQTLASYTEYRCTGGATEGIVTSLSLSLPQTIPTDYVSIIHFSTGANPDKTEFSIPATVLLCGTDVDIEDAEDGNGGTTQVYGFNVQEKTRYTIAFEWDGAYVRGYVTGVELI